MSVCQSDVVKMLTLSSTRCTFQRKCKLFLHH